MIDLGNRKQVRLAKKEAKRIQKKAKFRDKMAMYDMIIANLIAGNALIEPEDKLDSSQIEIGFSNISSENEIKKYFIVQRFPDYLTNQLFDLLRYRCLNPGIKMNFYIYGEPHKISWDSAEMRNKMTIWKQYSEEYSGELSVFEYRAGRGDKLARQRIMMSTKYLNEAELDHRRSLMRTSFMIEVSSSRSDEHILNMIETISSLKDVTNSLDIKLRELKVNMIDWMRVLGIFSLKSIPEIAGKLSKKIMTDDILSNFNSYKQGKVGLTGVPLGIDVLSSGPVLRKFKEDPDKAENWAISAETGGGKSYFVKTLITYLLADDFVVTVMDYEGEEYLNLAAYIKDGNQDDVKVISMGKGSTDYFDPCELPELTGDAEVDDDLKENAIGFITSLFRVIVAGLSGNLSQWEERVISMAIQRMYDNATVTNDKKTWKNSRGLRLHYIYEEIKIMVESKELVDDDADNVLHKAAMTIQNSAALYFEPGESKSGTFENPISANEFYKAKFIVFSFGMKGAASSLNDPITLALKQISVAYASIQISNYCKYVRRGFNVKVWEEYQRWGEIEGSADIISNAMTGGRKRGDVNLLVTNDLASLLDDDNKLNMRLRQNIQNYAVGRIRDKNVRSNFCKKFDLQDIESALDRIAKAHTSDDKGGSKRMGSANRYKHAFCVVMDDGKKAITKVRLPKAIEKSNLFRTGVDVKSAEEREREKESGLGE